MSTPAPRRRRPLRTPTAVGLAIQAATIAIEVLTPDFDVPIAPLVIAPLLTATAGLLQATAALSVLTLALSVVVIGFHDGLGEPDELIRLVSVAIICALAVVGTRLRRRVAELAQALDALPDAVTIQSANGTVLYGNRAAARHAGEPDGVSEASASAYLARMEVTLEDGAPLDPRRMPAQRLIAGEEQVGPVVTRTRDPASGAVTWARVQASPLRDPEGRVSSAVNVIEDITAVKLAEQRAAYLARAGAILGSSLDTEATLQATAQLVVPELADWCAIDLADAAGRPTLVALSHVDPEKVRLGHELRRRYPPDPALDEGVLRVLRTGEPELHTEIPHELLVAAARDPEHLALLEALGFVSALVVPLAIGPRVIGALTWVAAGERRHYGPEDLAMAGELAARAAVAVENARIHADRAEVATVLQRALLPRSLPQPAGWEVAAHYRSAGAAGDVGGDFYDVEELADGALLALIGDVSGKGAAAAALTARTRHTLMTTARLEGGDPRPGLALLNAAMQAGDELELCSVAVVVARGPELTVHVAGHPLPLLVRDGSLTELGTTSPMLGAAPAGAAWATATATLRPGDLLVLHTDGIPDAVGDQERFGEARLRAALLDGAATPQAAIDRVVSRVDAFERGAQADDRALLALGRR